MTYLENTETRTIKAHIIYIQYFFRVGTLMVSNDMYVVLKEVVKWKIHMKINVICYID